MTKHSQRTDGHSGVECGLYRVWGDETRVMRIFTQIRPTFIYLESDNLASALTQSSMSPGTSAQDLHRDQALSFYCGQGRK